MSALRVILNILLVNILLISCSQPNNTKEKVAIDSSIMKEEPVTSTKENNEQNEPVKAIDTLRLKIENTEYQTPKLEETKSYNNKDSIIYQLVSKKDINPAHEIWFFYNKNGYLERKLILDSYARVEYITYKYNSKNQVINIHTIHLSQNLERKYLYSGNLLAETTEMQGIMENTYKKQVFYYDNNEQLIAVRLQSSYDNWRSISSNQLLPIEEFTDTDLITNHANKKPTFSQEGVKSKLFRGGYFSKDGSRLEALDEKGRLAMEYSFNDGLADDTNISYYPNGFKKSVYTTVSNYSGDDYDSLEFTSWGDTARYVKFEYDFPALLSKYEYDQNHLPIKVIHQFQNGLEVKKYSYNQMNELADSLVLTSDFEDTRLNIAYRKIKELESKLE